MSRDERIKKFEVNNAPTVFVYREDIKRIDVDPSNPTKEFEAADLLRYHEAYGLNFQMKASIKNAGQSDSYLALECVKGGGWDQNQIDLNEQLEYVPLPDADVEGRDGMLILKKSIVEKEIKVGVTGWTVAHSYIERTQLDLAVIPEDVRKANPNLSAKVDVNDVVILWKHEAWNNFKDASQNQPNVDRYLASCWKWLA